MRSRCLVAQKNEKEKTKTSLNQLILCENGELVMSGVCPLSLYGFLTLQEKES